MPTLGLLMLQTRFPRPLGDIGHARTFNFAVRQLVVQGATPERVVRGRGEPQADDSPAHLAPERSQATARRQRRMRPGDQPWQRCPALGLLVARPQ